MCARGKVVLARCASLILIDDTDQPGGGKGARVIPYALDHGWRIAKQGRQQVLLERQPTS